MLLKKKSTWQLSSDIKIGKDLKMKYLNNKVDKPWMNFNRVANCFFNDDA